MERVVERSNVKAALKLVRKNKGSPGVDGMTVDELPKHLAEKSVFAELQGYLTGWKQYFRLAQTPGTFKELDGWIRRRLRVL